VDTARFVSQLRGITPDELAGQVSANFEQLFAIKTS
jgi:Tat protein secretion system quality control protein TatD with DNase activity